MTGRESERKQRKKNAREREREREREKRERERERERSFLDNQDVRVEEKKRWLAAPQRIVNDDAAV